MMPIRVLFTWSGAMAAQTRREGDLKVTEGDKEEGKRCLKANCEQKARCAEAMKVEGEALRSMVIRTG